MDQNDQKRGYVADYEKARAEGNSILTNSDRAVSARANIHKKIVAFSLFGEEPAYCECSIINASAIKKIYPGWEMWLFYDQSVPRHVIGRLKRLGVKLVLASEKKISHWPGTFWRFAAATIPGAQYVIFRDADSVVCEREKSLVDQWIASDKPFHIIRDWFTHTDLILAGLWGAYAPFMENIGPWVEAYLSRNEDLHPTHADQVFLAQCLWPRIKAFSLIHDSIHKLDNVVPFDAPKMHPSGKYALGGFRLRKYDLKSNKHMNKKYILKLVDDRDETIFLYHRELTAGKDSISLPYEYADKIESKAWKLEIEFAGS